MSRDREAEIETLRRENERLRREVAQRRETARARRMEAPPDSSHGRDQSPGASPALDDDRLAERLEDVINTMSAELTTALGNGVRSITCKLDNLNVTTSEDASEDDRELLIRLEQLSSEVQRLRYELAAARVRAGDAGVGDEGPDDVVSLAGIVIEQGGPAGQLGEHRWRRGRRPWFYLPLIWGLVVLVVVLIALLVWW